MAKKTPDTSSTETRGRKPTNPDSPAGIRNSWAKAKRAHDAIADRIARHEAMLAVMRRELESLKAAYDEAATRLRALI